MRPDHRKILFILLGAGLIAVLLWLLARSLEYYEEPVNLGWSEQARRNPFLAAEQLLERQAAAVKSSDSLAVLGQLSADATLIIGNANHVLSHQRAADLIAWMEEGGHVIVGAQVQEDADVLLSHFQISMEPLQESTDAAGDEPGLQHLLEQAEAATRAAARLADTEVAEAIREQEALTRLDNLIVLAFEGIDYNFHVDFLPGGSLSHPWLYLPEGEEYNGYHPFYWTGNEQAITFMQMEVGAGLLTVMADVGIWQSARLAHFDHAYLLQLLTEGAGEVAFLYGAVVPSFLDLMFDNFAESLLAALLFLFAWLAWRSRRFGPLAMENSGERRSFREHLQAVGEFHWRQGGSDHMLATARRDIWQQLHRRVPGMNSMGDAQQLEKLAEASQSEAAVLQTLMTAPVPAEEIRFYHTIRKLQDIRKRL